MLEFETEPLSGQLFANSDKCRFTSYWIDEGAWQSLQIITLTNRGPVINKEGTYNTIEDAMKDAEEFESSLGVKSSETF